MTRKITDEQPRVRFDCGKCPAFCCSVYPRVAVTPRDIKRLARHFGVTPEEAAKRYTKKSENARVLRRKGDPIFADVCRFLDPVTRGCTIYQARPAVCREYPGGTRCSYYDLMKFERRIQENPNAIPLIQISFQEPTEKTESDETKSGAGEDED